MNTDSLITGIVRVLEQDGKTVGTGFVAHGNGLIATCAHVVRLAGAEPGGTVHLGFLLRGERRAATVVPEYWRDENAQDVAFLQLREPLPQGVVSLRLGLPRKDMDNHRFSTFGFPLAKPVEGLAGEGTIVGWTTENGFPVLQLRSNEISRGFSGAPVLDMRRNLVVGMVVAITRPDDFGRLVETSFITPTSTLLEVCDLQLSDFEDWLETSSANLGANLYDQMLMRDPSSLDPINTNIPMGEGITALRLTERVAAKYAQGLKLYAAKEWRQALECFEEVQQLRPGYRDTERLLAQVRHNLTVPSIAIEFGTYKCRMAWYNLEAKQPEVILNSDGEPDMQSELVYFGEDETLVGKLAEKLVGEAAEDAAALEDTTAWEEIARRTFSLRQDFDTPPGTPAPDHPYVYRVAVATEILKKLKSDAEEYLDKEIGRAFITHPAGFLPLQWQRIEEAAHSAGFSDVIPLQEPVAIALAFAHKGLRIGTQVLVVQLGTVTSSVTVLENEDESFRIVLNRSISTGTEDFDQALYRYCNDLAQKELGRPITLSGVVDMRFMRECRNRKENLAIRERVSVSSILSGGVIFRHDLNRDTFEELTRSLVKRIVRETRAVVEEAKAYGLEVDTVLLAGSSGLEVHLVQQMLREILPVEPLRSTSLSAVLGAAYYANMYADIGRS